MQYFKPEGENLFVGDCMPFFHDGTFHLFYLLDENHHGALGGLGGHQWAHATSTDLIHWTHHPLAIPITEEREGSICTGSTFFHDGMYYGFYATRMRDGTQHLSVATSTDGIHFKKTEPNPFASPPKGYNPYNYRDPVVFQDDQTGFFHMLVTAWLEDYPIPDRSGCLAHLISKDLKNWEVKDSFIIPGLPDSPECPDYFSWNGWYYLVFSNGLTARYRMSRHPLGPWQRPEVDMLDGPCTSVMKTAAFGRNRRIGVAWLGTREANNDCGRFQWGGHTVFREVFQRDDGTLGTKSVPEMIPATGDVLDLPFTALTSEVTGNARRIHLKATEGLEVGTMSKVPRNIRITVRVEPGSESGIFGLLLRGDGRFESSYELCFSPVESSVGLFDQRIYAVDGLDSPFTLDVILKDDIIDVCFDNRRCLINRCPELQGGQLLFFGQNADVVFDGIEIRALV